MRKEFYKTGSSLLSCTDADIRNRRYAASNRPFQNPGEGRSAVLLFACLLIETSAGLLETVSLPPTARRCKQRYEAFIVDLIELSGRVNLPLPAAAAVTEPRDKGTLMNHAWVQRVKIMAEI